MARSQDILLDRDIQERVAVALEAATVPTEVNDLTLAVVWANIPDLNVPESAVTQHEAAIDHDALSGFVAAEHIDWSVTGAENINVDRIPDPLLLSDGTAGAPIYSFASEATTGFFRSASGTIGVAIGGGNRYLFTAGSFSAAATEGPAVLNESALAANPTLVSRRSDLDSGLGSAGADVPTIVAGGFEALRFTELNSEIIPAPNANVAVTAFATGGQGSATQLNSGYNVIATVATTADSVKLPPVFAVNSVVYIKNDGANAADVFPATGDDLGAGVNTAVSIAAGESLSFIATVADSTWTQLIAGGGASDLSGLSDVTITTPVTNQFGFRFDGADWVNVTGVTFDTADLKVAGTIRGLVTRAGAIRNVTASSTVPTLLPTADDLNSGIGAQSGSDNVIVIADGTFATQWRHSGAGDGSMQRFNQLVTGIVASTTQTQGNGVLNGAQYTEIITVANVDDVVTLPGSIVGQWMTLVNTGANRLQIFPSSGDAILPSGVDASITLEVNESITFFGLDTTNWIIQAQPESPAVGTYTRNATVVEDRTLLASASATTLNNNNVLAALIVDLQTRGIVG